MVTTPGKLGTLARADAELEDTSVTNKVPAAADNARVGQVCAQIVVAQVGMCIQMDDV